MRTQNVLFILLPAFALTLALTFTRGADPAIQRIWLSHESDPSKQITVCWEVPGEADQSVIEYGPSEELGKSLSAEEVDGRFRAVVPRGAGALFYQIRSGEKHSAIHEVKPWPADQLRIAITANWLRPQDLSAILEDDPDLLISAGDHIVDLIDKPDVFGKFIDTYPDLFSTIPFLPVLGNHDRQVRPRGNGPPAEPVYDIEAAAFIRHFALPGDEWKWKLDIEHFDFRILALDLNHTSDVGTTWQSSHDFDSESAQFQWYEKVTRSNPPHTITVQNEQNSRIRRFAGGIWEEPLSRGSLCVAGFGYFAERAAPEGFTCYNVSLNGKGNQYPDPASEFLAAENNYLLLTVPGSPGPMVAELKSLAGEVLDRKEIPRKKPN